MELLNHENAKINFKNEIKKIHFKPEITHLLKYKKLLTKEVQKSREKRKFRAVIIELSKPKHFFKNPYLCDFHLGTRYNRKKN